jgi:cytochrome c553
MVHLNKWTTAVCLMVVFVVRGAAADDAPLHGKKLAVTYCAACHGEDGNSTDPQFPKIAGQKDFYLREQLRAFKRGTRKSEIMSGALSAISDSQIGELADYFSRQAVKPDPVKDPQLARIGAQIFQAPQRGAPPCAMCHGGSGYAPMGPMMGRGGMMMGGHGGMMGPGRMMENTASVPNLNGQHAAYLTQQLDAFAKGARQGTVMNQIAAGLNEMGRKAVSEYLSGLR